MSAEIAARVENAIALWWERGDADPVLPDLILGLSDPLARPRALRGLRLLGPSAAPALPALCQCLTCASAEDAPAISCTMAVVCPDHPVVLDRLAHGTEEERFRVLLALGEAGEAARGAETAIRAATRDPSPQVRWQAATTLWSVARRADIVFTLLRREPFLEILYDDREHELYGASWPSLRKMWPWFVGLIAEIVASHRRYLDDLRHGLEGRGLVECLNACRVIYLVDGRDSSLVDPIRRVLLNVSSFQAFVASCEMLAALGPTARSAVDVLERLAVPVPPLWRDYADRALIAIRGGSGAAPDYGAG
ncbi:MAG: hypothetical protein AB1714_04755 [Acidobacteriota bacterium]